MPKVSEIMTNSQQKKVHAIIHSASASAAAIGGGLANIPGSDAPVLLTVQTSMIIAIGKVFDRSISESMAKAIVAQFLGVSVGKTLANLLTGWLPGIGNGVNAATAASLTELIGWTVVKDFATDTETLDSESLETISRITEDAGNSLKRTPKIIEIPQKEKGKVKGLFKRKQTDKT